MSKYAPLAKHLSSLPNDQNAETLSFARVDLMVGGMPGLLDA